MRFVTLQKCPIAIQGSALSWVTWIRSLASLRQIKKRQSYTWLLLLFLCEAQVQLLHSKFHCLYGTVILWLLALLQANFITSTKHITTQLWYYYLVLWCILSTIAYFSSPSLLPGPPCDSKNAKISIPWRAHGSREWACKKAKYCGN